MSKERAEEFYGEHRGKAFFDDLIGFMTSGKVIVLCLEKFDAIRAWRLEMGPTDSELARKIAPTSIRALFGLNNQQNACHGSDSLLSSEREINFWFPEGFIIERT